MSSMRNSYNLNDTGLTSGTSIKYINRLESNLKKVCHVDFSENYTCKCSDEVQSMHFGGSHQQASVHTGVYYTKDGVFPFFQSHCVLITSRIFRFLSDFHYFVGYSRMFSYFQLIRLIFTVKIASFNFRGSE